MPHPSLKASSFGPSKHKRLSVNTLQSLLLFATTTFIGLVLWVNTKHMPTDDTSSSAATAAAVPLRSFSHQNNDDVTYAIMGGTGMQGGAAIDYLLQSAGVPPSNIRTLTRSKESPAARTLSSKGVIVMEGKQSIGSGGKEEVEAYTQSLAAFFDGVDCIFAITFTQYDSMTREEQLGRYLFEVIADSSTVTQVVFSGGERTGIKVLDAKADIERAGREILLNTGIRCTFLHTSFFMENVLIKGKHKRFRKIGDGDGNQYHLSLPIPKDRAIAMISARDIGTCAGHILSQRPFEAANPYTAINIIGDLVSPETFMQAMKEVLPEYVFAYRRTKHEELVQAMGEAQASLVSQMYDVYYEQNSDEDRTKRQMDITRKVCPVTKDIREWIASYARGIIEQ